MLRERGGGVKQKTFTLEKLEYQKLEARDRKMIIRSVKDGSRVVGANAAWKSVEEEDEYTRQFSKSEENESTDQQISLGSDWEEYSSVSNFIKPFNRRQKRTKNIMKKGINLVKKYTLLIYLKCTIMFQCNLEHKMTVIIN